MYNQWKYDKHGRIITQCFGCSHWRDSDKLMVRLRPMGDREAKYWCQECWDIYVAARKNKQGHVDVTRDWFEEPKDGHDMVCNPNTGETVRWKPMPVFSYCPKCWPTPVPVSIATGEDKPVRFKGGITDWVHGPVYFCPFCHPDDSRLPRMLRWKRRLRARWNKLTRRSYLNVRGYRYSELIQGKLEGTDAQPPNGDSHNPRMRGRIA